MAVAAPQRGGAIDDGNGSERPIAVMPIPFASLRDGYGGLAALRLAA